MNFDKIICTTIWVKVVFMMNSSNAFLKPHKNNNNISFRHIVIREIIWNIGANNNCTEIAHPQYYIVSKKIELFFTK